MRMSVVSEVLSVANAILTIYKACADAPPKIGAACETVHKIKTWLVTIVEEDLERNVEGLTTSPVL